MNASPDVHAEVVYEITYTDAHVLALWRHLRRFKRRSRVFMQVFRVGAGLILVGLIALMLWLGGWRGWYLTAALLGILGVLVFSEQIDAWLVVRRWRKSPSRDKLARLAFSADGLRGHSEFSESSSKWAAFTAAVRFPEGFLIFSGPYLPYWFPDAALVQGTPAEAATLFRANIPHHKEA